MDNIELLLIYHVKRNTRSIRLRAKIKINGKVRSVHCGSDLFELNPSASVSGIDMADNFITIRSLGKDKKIFGLTPEESKLLKNKTRLKKRLSRL